MQFAIASIRQLKLYKSHYILADRAYDTMHKLRSRCIQPNSIKNTSKPELNIVTIFWHDVYARKMNVESVIYVIKRRFNG